MIIPFKPFANTVLKYKPFHNNYYLKVKFQGLHFQG